MAVCPSCGEQVPDGAEWCLSCGSRIEKAEAKPPQAAPQPAAKTAESLIAEGKEFYNSKKFDKAVESFDEALKLEPKNPKALLNKALALKDWGIALDDKEKVKSSIEAFDKALEIDPRNGEIWYNKGMVLGLLEEFDKAVECFDTALKLDPGNTTYEMMYSAAKDQARERKAAPPPSEEKVEVVEVAAKPAEKKKAPVRLDVKVPFPKNYTALIQGPPGVGKHEYCLDLLKYYLKNGESVVYITTERSPQEIKEKLKETGFDLDVYEASKFLFIDVYSYSTGTKYDKGLHVDNPANLNLINIHLANAAGMIGKPMRIFLDSLSNLFLHAPVGEIRKFVGTLSSRAKSEYGFVLYTMQEGMHDEQTVAALRAMMDAVLEMAFEEGPPLKRRFRVHHAKGIKTEPTWYIFEIEKGFQIIGQEAAPAAAGEVVVKKLPMSMLAGGALVILVIGFALFRTFGGGGEGMKAEFKDVYSMTLDKTVNVGGQDVQAFIKLVNRIDEKAPKKGWLLAETPFYRLEINLDRSFYLLYDKLNEKDLLVYNDKVESKTDWLTGSGLGFADVDAENLVPFSALAVHDVNGIEHKIVLADDKNGFLLLGTEGWDFQVAERTQGYDVEGEEFFLLFADKPYYIDAVEVNNLQVQGYAPQVGFRNPDEIVKDWVLRGDYDSGVTVGGDPEHMNKETSIEWAQVQTIGGVRKPWHSGSAEISKMFPNHIVVGNKLNGGIVFSLPQGIFRWDDSQGARGAQVVLQFLILVEKPEKAIAFTSEPVNREAFLYDIRDYQNIKGYKEAMQQICAKYKLDCPTDGVLNNYDWNTKRFAYVITLTKDWYDAAKNQPKAEVIALANEGLEEFKRNEELILNQMKATKPLISKLVVR